MNRFSEYIIITPSYNRPDDLERFIRSVINSGCNYTRLAIYVDGGGLGELKRYEELKKEYMRKYPQLFHIFKISEENKGVSYARHYLMSNSHAHCSFMIWVDDDQELEKDFEAILDDELKIVPINYFNLHRLIEESGPSSLSDIINLDSENTLIFKSSFWKDSGHFVEGEILLPEWFVYHDIAGVNGYYKHKGSIVTYVPNPDDPSTLTGKTKDESWWRDVNHVGYTLHYNLLHRLIVTGQLKLKPNIQSRLMRWHLKQSIYNMIRTLGEEETANNLHKVLSLDVIRDLL